MRKDRRQFENVRDAGDRHEKSASMRSGDTKGSPAPTESSASGDRQGKGKSGWAHSEKKGHGHKDREDKQ